MPIRLFIRVWEARRIKNKTLLSSWRNPDLSRSLSNPQTYVQIPYPEKNSPPSSEFLDYHTLSNIKILLALSFQIERNSYEPSRNSRAPLNSLLLSTLPPHTYQPQINATTTPATPATPANTLALPPFIAPTLGVLVGVGVLVPLELIEEMVEALVDGAAELGNVVCGRKLPVSPPIEVSKEIEVNCTVWERVKGGAEVGNVVWATKVSVSPLKPVYGEVECASWRVDKARKRKKMNVRYWESIWNGGG